jgi:hypothetical protein
MNNQILTPRDLNDNADNFRLVASKFRTERIPKLQAELKKLRDDGAPLNLINAKLAEIDDTDSSRNACLTKATKLDNIAILGTLTSTDVTNAQAILVCSTAKVILAVDRLNEIRSALKFVAAFIDLAASIIAAVPTGGISLARIKDIIQKIDALSKSDLSGGLSTDEKKKLKKMLEDCLPSDGI